MAELTILDAGCGEGYACRELVRRGEACRIVGIDVSPRLVEKAEMLRCGTLEDGPQPFAEQFVNLAIQLAIVTYFDWIGV
jgi:SAM-dependent methyltransferase